MYGNDLFTANSNLHNPKTPMLSKKVAGLQQASLVQAQETVVKGWSKSLETPKIISMKTPGTIKNKNFKLLF